MDFYFSVNPLKCFSVKPCIYFYFFICSNYILIVRPLQNIYKKHNYHRLFFRLFSINDAGEVKLTGDPATMTKGNYELFVIVQDNGQPPRQDSAFIVVVSAVSNQTAPVVEQEIDMVAIILLSVFCGCLALIIAILAVYIYKK